MIAARFGGERSAGALVIYMGMGMITIHRLLADHVSASFAFGATVGKIGDGNARLAPVNAVGFVSAHVWFLRATASLAHMAEDR